MRMQIRKVMLVLVAVWLVACASLPADTRTRADLQGCEKIPSLRGLRIYVDQSWKAERIEFDGNGLTRVTLPEDAWKSISPKGSLWDSAQSLQGAFPAQGDRLSAGEKLVLPAAISPNGQFRVAGLAVKEGDSSPKSAVIRANGDHHRIAGTPGYSIGAVAWGPDSTRLAFVEYNYKLMVRGFRDFISPHPVPYSDFIVTVYRVTGEAICQSALVANARYGTSKIAWLLQ
jgi:hypothetical protein